jgi:hypothetical protein
MHFTVNVSTENDVPSSHVRMGMKRTPKPSRGQRNPLDFLVGSRKARAVPNLGSLQGNRGPVTLGGRPFL